MEEEIVENSKDIKIRNDTHMKIKDSDNNSDNYDNIEEIKDINDNNIHNNDGDIEKNDIKMENISQYDNNGENDNNDSDNKNNDIEYNENDKSYQEKRTFTRFPIAKIKNIIKMNPEVKLCVKELYPLLGKATELLFNDLAINTSQIARFHKRRTLNPEDVYSAARRNETYAFIDFINLFPKETVDNFEQKEEKLEQLEEKKAIKDRHVFKNTNKTNINNQPKPNKERGFDLRKLNEVNVEDHKINKANIKKEKKSNSNAKNNMKIDELFFKKSK